MSRYIYNPENPLEGVTKASTFGGPNDPDDAGGFAFGGRSEIDGEINPEFYAAFPEELYDKGVVKPGGIYTVKNPKTGVAIPVVARDKGPSAKNRGLDLAPHAMSQLGAKTDEDLVVDFNPIGEAPKVGTGPNTADAMTPTMSLAGVDTSDFNLGEPVQASPLGGSGSLASVLSPINEAEYGTSIDAETGERIEPDHDTDDVEELSHDDVKGFVSSNPKPVKTNPDGSITFDDGVTAYPDGSIQKGGFVFTQTPDGKIAKRSIGKTSTPSSVMEEAAARKGILKEDFKSYDEFKKAARNVLDTASGQSDTDTEIAEAIISGNQPPDLKGLYRHGPGVKRALQSKGYNLTDAQMDWQATQRHIATLEGPQQLRMRQAVDNSFHSLDVIEDLSNQWDAGGFPLLNKARLMSAKQGLLGPDAQKLAVALDAQINDVTSELGNVYMGGNSPTDHSLKLAQSNLNSDWSRETLKTMLDQTRKNLVIRDNSIKNVGSSRSDNRYETKPQDNLAPAAPSATPSPAAAPERPEVAAARRVLADPKRSPEDKQKAQTLLTHLGF